MDGSPSFQERLGLFRKHGNILVSYGSILIFNPSAPRQQSRHLFKSAMARKKGASEVLLQRHPGRWLAT
jgi:hypothetical protein